MFRFLKLPIFLFIIFYSSITLSNPYYNSRGSIDNGDITSAGSTPIGIGSVYRKIRLPPNHQGAKVKFSAKIKSTNVEGGAWTGLWLRADEHSNSGDGKGKGKYYRIYAPIKGTSNWEEKTVDLVIPLYSEYVSYGITLQGSGRIEIRNGKFSWY